MSKAVEKWLWLVRRLPRQTRIELLEALAYPEFQVTRSWLTVAEGEYRVEQIPLGETMSKEEFAALSLGISPAHLRGEVVSMAGEKRV